MTPDPTQRPSFHHVVLFYVGLILVLCIIAAGLWRRAGKRAVSVNLDPDGRIAEPSGLVYHPGRNTLFVVGDEGQLAELTPAGEVLRDQVVGGDLEGVTLDEARNVLYAVDEGAARVLEIDISTLAVRRRLDPAPLLAQARVPPQSDTGLEGIALQPERDGSRPAMLWLANQKPPVILRCLFDPEAGALALQDTITAPGGLQAINDLSYDERTGMVFAAGRKDGLLLLLADNGMVVERRLLPGKAPEGVALLPDGRLAVADDTGGVLLHPASSKR